MPRTKHIYEWADAEALRTSVLEECRRRFELLFGEPCGEVWLSGWRTAANHLVKQDAEARELRHNGSVRLAAEFLQKRGARAGAPATAVVTPHTLALQCEVQDALAEDRRRLLPVGATAREISKLTASGLEVTILLFENHSDANGRSRWLTDLELAVLSLLLRPERVHVDDRDLTERAAPRVALEREAKNIKGARRKSGELKTPADKRWGMGTALDRPQPLLKPVPTWLGEHAS